MAGTVLGILAAALAVERWTRLSRRVLRHYRSVAVFLGGHDSLERGITSNRAFIGTRLNNHPCHLLLNRDENLIRLKQGNKNEIGEGIEREEPLSR